MIGQSGLKAVLDGGVMETADQEVHAGEIEVSCIMAIDEEAVKMEHAVDYVPKVSREFLDYVPMKAISPCGVWGEFRPRPQRRRAKDAWRRMPRALLSTF